MNLDRHYPFLSGFFPRTLLTFHNTAFSLVKSIIFAGALMFIYLNERVISKQIAEYYSLDKGSVTSLINGLVKNEFIIKESHPLDKRSSYLTLTNKALEVMPSLQKIFENWSNNLLEGIPKKEQDQLVFLLEKMIANT